MRSRQRGLSLIELMISMGLGLLLLSAVLTLLVATRSSARQNERLVGLQDQGRFALSLLSRELAMAGYMGGIRHADLIRPNPFDTDGTNDQSSANLTLPASADCGPDAATSWAFDLSRALQFRNQDSPLSAAGLWRCLSDAIVAPGTDIVGIRRVSGAAAGTVGSGGGSASLAPYGYYLKTNAVAGTMIRWGASATGESDVLDAPALPPYRFHDFLPRLYFVRSYTRTPGDGQPALCRKTLCTTGLSGTSGSEAASCGAADAAAAASGIYTECVAEGVEDLQIVWGMDTDGNGSPDQYTSSPSAADLNTQAVTAQLALRVRSRSPGEGYTDENSYTLGDRAAFVPTESDDTTIARYYRRVFTTTVKLRNGGG